MPKGRVESLKAEMSVPLSDRINQVRAVLVVSSKGHQLRSTTLLGIVVVRCRCSASDRFTKSTLGLDALSALGVCSPLPLALEQIYAPVAEEH